MDTGKGNNPKYIESSSSTVAGEAEYKDLEPFYQVSPSTGEAEYKDLEPFYQVSPSTGEAEDDTSKPKRIKFKVQRVKGL